ncbi:signal protein PDZ [Mangrovactinospora gilvigrisea]|uniref:Signal protein PDZ n=1 Tax=Mangrovactinospora gilvigrisea TaxID=1428644 RepID=A0A1J7C714_9ACTN|nr:trypsin-like peptidase domain-containing protein [Mangrovactinospora gilvigrisea]OIV35434.1 signal protein PDZ [Mangrovactinospora gilvigrisea]
MRQHRQRTARIRTVLGAACATLAAAALIGGCSSSGSGDSKASPTSTASADKPTSGGLPSDAKHNGAATQLEEDYQATIKAVLPSVVQITAGDSLGSGIVYDGKGHIVTNAHVVGSAKSFTVTLANSSQQLKASLTASYPTDDLAVIKLDNPPSSLHVAGWESSGSTAVGQIVLAMGNPLGLSSSVTQGIVSATGRTVSEPSGGGSPGATIPNMVQTSAAINPGNSGGALVGLDNKVVGINTLAATDPELGGSAAPGIGFAIPSDTVKSVADQLISQGKVTNSGRAALGVTVRTVIDSNFQPAGAGIVSVASGQAAAKAGLKDGDVITGIDSTHISSADDLTSALAGLKPGQQVTVHYTRDGAKRTASATLTQLQSQ